MVKLHHDNVDIGVIAGVAAGAVGLVGMFAFMASLLACPKKAAGIKQMDRSVEVTTFTVFQSLLGLIFSSF